MSVTENVYVYKPDGIDWVLHAAAAAAAAAAAVVECAVCRGEQLR